MKEVFHQIKTNKNIKDTNIIMFSDLHYSQKSDLNLLCTLTDYILKNKPDYICIPGDIIDSSNLTMQEMENLHSFFTYIAKKVPVIISLGNHDLMAKINKKWIPYKNDEYLNLLSSIDNVYLLDNAVLDLDKISFSGHTLQASHYESFKESKEDFYKQLDKIKFKEAIDLLNDSAFNVNLFHSPHNILKKEFLDYTQISKKTDLLLCGHMHGGLVPKQISGLFGSVGFISPSMELFPRFTRGELVKDNMTTIISTGLHKAELPFMDKFIPPVVENILIKKI